MTDRGQKSVTVNSSTNEEAINEIKGCSFSPRCPSPSSACKNQSVEMELIQVGEDHYADKCCTECG